MPIYLDADISNLEKSIKNKPLNQKNVVSVEKWFSELSIDVEAPR